LRSHQCYYCGQLFDTKEKLYDHLEVHSKASEEKPKKRKKSKKKMVESGESSLSEDEIIEQFNVTKSGEPSRMASKG